nr:MAG TPA: hypothetical protein [Caudoviricetes sp.]
MQNISTSQASDCKQSLKKLERLKREIDFSFNKTVI